MNCISLLLIALHLSLRLPDTQGHTIRLFEGPDATGSYSHEFLATDTGECTEIPAVINPLKGSVQTDGCVLVYEGSSCTDYSIKVVNGSENVNGYTWTTPDSTGAPQADSWPSFAARSFRACSLQGDGGSQVNVDILQNRQVVLSWRNLCGCRNVPRALETERLSLDNHGNEIYAYQKEDCTGDYQVIPAGRNPLSENLADGREPGVRRKYPAKGGQSNSNVPRRWTMVSVRPGNCTAYTQNCIQLRSSIYKFEFLKPEGEGATVGQVELAGRKEFVNTGPVVQASTYTVTKTIRESLEIEVSSELREMHTVGVEASVSVETEAGIPFIGTSKVTASLTSSYERSWERASSERQSILVENERSVRMTQKMEVPPCTRYTASASMTFAKNKVVPYKTYSKVTGEIDGDRMTASQIREYVNGGLELREDWDEFTVVAVTTGSVKAEHEVSSQISGQGERIQDCEDGLSSGGREGGIWGMAGESLGRAFGAL